MQTGRIITLLGGFYRVETAEGALYETRARGNFRKRGLAPVVGDFVDFEDDYILKIHERRNALRRPALANVDQVVVVMSTVSPAFSLNLLDRFLAYLEYKAMAPLIYLTKLDLLEDTAVYDKLRVDYARIGYEMVFSKNELLPRLAGKVTVLMGQTGVGKTTLLNGLAPDMEDLATAETSEKLGRGRHTTRHVELYPVAGGLLADTPGFSSLDYEVDTAPALNRAFVDIYKVSAGCKFRECTHTHEPGCAVKAAVAARELLQSRYDSYLQLLSEINKTREVYAKKAKKQQ